MKKALLAFTALILFCTHSFAQQTEKDSLSNTYKKEFLLNAASFAVGGFEIGYGQIKNNRNNRLFLGYYFSESPDFYGTEEFLPLATEYKNMEGFRAEFQHLFMKPTKSQLRYYGGGYAVFKTIRMDISKTAFSSSTTTSIDYTANAVSGGFGIIGGVRAYIIDNFFVDIYLGGGVIIPFSSKNIDDVHLDVLNPYKRSINPRAGISLGIAL